MPYINGIGLISPQHTVENSGFLTEVAEYTADYLKCIEPVYRNYIDPIQLRRMSRLIRMGISAAKISLQDAGLAMPDAIITGTGLGSVEDTEKILADISRQEQFLNPALFIQSTYNTISSQIAIQLKCHHYNSTYVHRTFSLESGLMDGLMQLQEATAGNILVGGIDEMTMNHLLMTRRIGLWKLNAVNNLKLLEENSNGALAGEGAAYFVIGNDPSPAAYARLLDASTIIRLNDRFDLGRSLKTFLSGNELEVSDIDLVVLGVNGDFHYDTQYYSFASEHFPEAATAWYKHLCGEYHTASGFGLYLAANILKHQIIPEVVKLRGHSLQKIRNILIYNHFRNVNHAFILVQAV